MNRHPICPFLSGTFLFFLDVYLEFGQRINVVDLFFIFLCFFFWGVSSEDVSASNVEKKNPGIGSNSLRDQVDQRRKFSICAGILASYIECPQRIVALENAKNAILR